MKENCYLRNILLQLSNLKNVLESPTQHGTGGLVDPTRFNSWAGKGVASSILPSVKEITLTTRVKMLESKVASMEAQLQERIDSDSDAKAKIQALEAKVADLEARPPKESKIEVPYQRVSLWSKWWRGSRMRR